MRSSGSRVRLLPEICRISEMDWPRSVYEQGQGNERVGRAEWETYFGIPKKCDSVADQIRT